VPKYQQIFCNTEFGSLKFTPQETAIVCELLLRGPQTPGELRARVPRLAQLAEGSVIETLLEQLANRPEGAIVQQLPREAGRRDSRWVQLFEELPSGVAAAADEAPATSAPQPKATRLASEPSLTERVAALETAVAQLRAELAALKQQSP
jgi:uncharacterized protein YceH (UPF0502 family)